MSKAVREYADDFAHEVTLKIQDGSFDGTNFTCGESIALVYFLREWARTCGLRDGLLAAADTLERLHAADDIDPDDEHYTDAQRAYDEHAETCEECCVLDLVWCEVGAPLYAAVEAREKPQTW